MHIKHFDKCSQKSVFAKNKICIYTNESFTICG